MNLKEFSVASKQVDKYDSHVFLSQLKCDNKKMRTSKVWEKEQEHASTKGIY